MAGLRLMQALAGRALRGKAPRRIAPPAAPRVALACAVAVLALAATAALLAPDASAGAVLDNGAVRLGMADLGNLVVPGSSPTSSASTTSTGLRFVAANNDGVAAGCGCEGWGAAATMAGASGTAVPAAGWVKGGAASGASLVSFGSTPTTATSVVDAAGLRVTHAAKPSPSPHAFQLDVTLENAGEAVASDVRYRRVVDWSVDPQAGAEYVSLHAATPLPSWLLFSSDDGGASADPLAGASQLLAAGPPGAPGVDDSGPTDHGALFDLGLGCLGPGDRVTFQMFYGAAPSEATALSTLVAMGAQAWSLAQPAADGAGGTPQTFFLAFAGIDGPACLAPAFTTLFTTTHPQDLTIDPVLFTDTTDAATLAGLEHKVEWAFGDGGLSQALAPLHPYAAPGPKHACLHLSARAPASTGPWRTWRSCTDVEVNDRPPVVDFKAVPTPDGTGVAFTDLSTDPDSAIVLRAWKFGDGKGSTATSPTHIFPGGGTYNVCLTATDDFARNATLCRKTGAPGATNHPPVLVPIHSRQVAVGALVTLALTAFDGDGDTMSFAAEGLPKGAHFDAAVGGFSWQPTSEQVGMHNIHFNVTDGRGGYAARTFIVLVSQTLEDGDHDGVPDGADSCPAAHDSEQRDTDGDGIGDACDRHTEEAPDARDIYMGPAAASGTGTHRDACTVRGAPDRDSDGTVDACDGDIDGDGVPNHAPLGSFLDNCPLVPNADQADSDDDGYGDACAIPTLAGQGGTAKAQAARPASPRADADVAGVQVITRPDRALPGWFILVPFVVAGIALGIGVGQMLRRRK